AALRISPVSRKAATRPELTGSAPTTMSQGARWQRFWCELALPADDSEANEPPAQSGGLLFLRHSAAAPFSDGGRLVVFTLCEFGIRAALAAASLGAAARWCIVPHRQPFLELASGDGAPPERLGVDRKSTRLNSSH